MNYSAATLLRSLAGELLVGAGSVLGLSIEHWFGTKRGRRNRPLAVGRRPLAWRRLDHRASQNISRGQAAAG
jgi:hypothetical protein